MANTDTRLRAATSSWRSPTSPGNKEKIKCDSLTANVHESSDSACIKGGVPNKDLKDAEKLAFYEKTALDVGSGAESGSEEGALA